METLPIRKDIYDRLQAADWLQISKNLMAFAIWFARKTYGWQDPASDQLPKGMKVEDIVQQVILKTIDGRRQWDPAKGQLEPWLKDQIKSELDALYKSAARKHETHSGRLYPFEKSNSAISRLFSRHECIYGHRRQLHDISIMLSIGDNQPIFEIFGSR